MSLFKHSSNPPTGDDPFSELPGGSVKPRRFSRAQLRPYSPEEILTLVQLNEMTAIEIADHRKTALIGARTSGDQFSGTLGPKRYFVGDRLYSDLTLFRQALEPYIKDGVVSVLSVDGVMANKLK